MFQKNSELIIEQSNRKNYIKMLKCMSDKELEILEKPVKKKQISLNYYFDCSYSSNSAKHNSKTKKTSSSQ